MWVLALSFWGLGSTFDVRAFLALRHGLHLNGVVTWYGRGDGNVQQYYLSTLIIYSLLWCLGGLGLLLAGWIHNRPRSASQQQKQGQIPKQGH